MLHANHPCTAAITAGLVLAALLSACTPIGDVGRQPSPQERAGDAGGGAEAPPESAGGSGSGSGGEGGAAGGSGRVANIERSSGGSGGKPMAADRGAAGAAAVGGGSTRAAAGMAGDTPTEDPPVSTEPLDPAQTAIAAETSDKESLELLSDWTRLPVLGLGQHRQQSSHDRGVDLRNETTLLSTVAHGNRDMNNFICKSADAEIRDSTLLPFHYDMPDCSESYVRGVAIGRFEGSGRLTRLWLTASELSNDMPLSGETLRVYADDNPRAVLQAPLEQVRTGGAGEIFANPFGATSRSFVAWHYPVAFSKKLLVVLDHLNGDYYYQVDAVLDAQPHKRAVPRSRLGTRDRAHALLEAASPVAANARSLHAEQLALAAGEQRDVMLAGPATVEELRLRVPKSQLASLTSTQVSVRWDGAKQPAIDAPLLDLFASSHAPPERSNLALAAAADGDTLQLSLRLPMPFETSAQFTIKNAGSAAIGAQLEWLGEATVPVAPYGHLSVQVHTVPLPTDQLEQTMASATGRGRFVGVCGDLAGHHDASVPNIANLDLLQGDFRALADGERVLDGTGTEDYVDNALFFKESPKATPFAQNWARVDNGSARPAAQVSFCRWQILGSEIDFQQSFQITRELSQYDTSIVERQHTVAFLYLE